MTRPSPGAVPGFDRPETFEVKAEFKNHLLSLTVPAIGLFLISGLLFLAISGAFGLPPLTGGLAALLFTAAMIAWKKRQFESLREGTALTISPEGFVVDDPHTTLQMAWSGVRTVGRVKSPKPIDVRKTSAPVVGGGGSSVAGGLGAAIGQATIDIQTGILGLGTHALKPDAPWRARTQFEQNVGINGVDEETGQNFVAVLAQLYDADWQSGRIGDWVRAYRPDVMPASI
jgi:hypothetical protein